MKVTVYALTRDDGRRVAGRGVAGERLRRVRLGSVAAIVGDVAKPPSPTEARLRAYMTLVGTLAAGHHALLPVRFGTTIQDDKELATLLRARQKTIRSRLSHVRGRVQMTVRIVVGRTPSGSRGGRSKVRATGTQYLTTRAREARASSIQEFAPLARAVERWVRDERVEIRGGVATVYHLIPRAVADRYGAAIEASALAARVRGTVSGPWPAHAFADSW